MKIKPRINYLLFPLALFAAGFIFAYFYFMPESDIASTTNVPLAQEESETDKQNTQEQETVIKESVQLNVPFTVQAPFASWNINEESCEEATLMMAKYYLDGRTSFDGSTVIPQQTVMDDLAKMKKWQVDNYGKEPDLTVKELSEFAKAFYKVNGRIVNLTEEEIKKELSLGSPIIVPATTASLKNPYYPANTDTYHFFVIKGYNSNGIIANDPGTKRGESYFYTWDTLFSTLKASQEYVKQDFSGLVLLK